MEEDADKLTMIVGAKLLAETIDMLERLYSERDFARFMAAGRRRLIVKMAAERKALSLEHSEEY